MCSNIGIQEVIAWGVETFCDWVKVTEESRGQGDGSH